MCVWGCVRARVCVWPQPPCCLPPIKIPVVIKADLKRGNAADKGERLRMVIMWREREREEEEEEEEEEKGGGSHIFSSY